MFKIPSLNRTDLNPENPRDPRSRNRKVPVRFQGDGYRRIFQNQPHWVGGRQGVNTLTFHGHVCIRGGSAPVRKLNIEEVAVICLTFQRAQNTLKRKINAMSVKIRLFYIFP